MPRERWRAGGLRDREAWLVENPQGCEAKSNPHKGSCEKSKKQEGDARGATVDWTSKPPEHLVQQTSSRQNPVRPPHACTWDGDRLRSEIWVIYIRIYVHVFTRGLYAIQISIDCVYNKMQPINQNVHMFFSWHKYWNTWRSTHVKYFCGTNYFNGV